MKVNGLFKRWQKNLHTPEMLPEGKKFGDFKDGEFSQEEFKYLENNQWLWKEKIDGTNIRIYLELLDNGGAAYEFKGKTDGSLLPATLVKWLENWVRQTDFSPAFPDAKVGFKVTLYGEGCGAKIQKGGGNYGEQHFKLFDILIGDFWLQPDDVATMATDLGLTYAPVVLTGTIAEAIEFTKKEPNSTFGDFKMEGVVGCPAVRLNNAMGNRIITKVKVKDFK